MFVGGKEANTWASNQSSQPQSSSWSKQIMKLPQYMSPHRYPSASRPRTHNNAKDHDKAGLASSNPRSEANSVSLLPAEIQNIYRVSLMHRDKLAPHHLRTLAVEGCCLCLRTTLDLPDNTRPQSPSCFILTCPLLGCQHILHHSCAVQRYLQPQHVDRPMPSIYTDCNHSTEYMRSVPSTRPSFQSELSTALTTQDSFTLDLRFSHILSNAHVFSFTAHLPVYLSKQNNPFVEQALGRESPEVPLLRGELSVICTNNTTSQQWKHCVNYDFTRCVDYTKYVAIFSSCRNILGLGISVSKHPTSGHLRAEMSSVYFEVACAVLSRDTYVPPLQWPQRVDSHTPRKQSPLVQPEEPLSSQSSGTSSGTSFTETTDSPWQSEDSLSRSRSYSLSSESDRFEEYKQPHVPQHELLRYAPDVSLPPRHQRHHMRRQVVRSTPVSRSPMSRSPTGNRTHNRRNPMRSRGWPRSTVSRSSSYSSSNRASLSSRSRDSRSPSSNSRGNLEASTTKSKTNPETEPADLDITLEEIKGKVVELAKTHNGSRCIQHKLGQRDHKFFEVCFDEILPHVPELMIDNFGHFAMERLITQSSPDQILTLLTALAPTIVFVSCQKHGSFSIQSLVDRLSTPTQIYTLVESLRKQMIRLIMHSSGHFVVLRMIQRLDYQYTKCIDEIITTSMVSVGTDHYGLRVVKAILTTRRPEQLNLLLTHIARITMKLVENQYGNYVIQSALEVGNETIRSSIKSKMEGKYVLLSKQKFSSNVVEKCLKQSSSQWRSNIIQELIEQPGVAELLRDRFGNYVLQTALSVSSQSNMQGKIKQAITPYLPSLRENVRSKWKRLLRKATRMPSS